MGWLDCMNLAPSNRRARLTCQGDMWCKRTEGVQIRGLTPFSQKHKRGEDGTPSICAIPPFSQRTRKGWGTEHLWKGRDALLLNAEVGENLGLGFVRCQQIMAGRAVLGDAGATPGHVLPLLAAEAARIAHVADMVGMRAPGHLHERKNVLTVEDRELLARRFHQRCLRCQHLGMFGTI